MIIRDTSKTNKVSSGDPVNPLEDVENDISTLQADIVDLQTQIDNVGIAFYDTDPTDTSITMWFNTTQNKIKVRLPSGDIYSQDMIYEPPPPSWTFDAIYGGAAAGWTDIYKAYDGSIAFDNYTYASIAAGSSLANPFVFTGQNASFKNGSAILAVKIGLAITCNTDLVVAVSTTPSFDGVAGSTYGNVDVPVTPGSGDVEVIYIDITAEKSWVWADFDYMDFDVTAFNSDTSPADIRLHGAFVEVTYTDTDPTALTESTQDYYFLQTGAYPAYGDYQEAWQNIAYIGDNVLATYASNNLFASAAETPYCWGWNNVAISPVLTDTITKVELGVRAYTDLSGAYINNFYPRYENYGVDGDNIAVFRNDPLLQVGEAGLDYTWFDITHDTQGPTNWTFTYLDNKLGYRIYFSKNNAGDRWIYLDDIIMRVTTVTPRA